MKLCIAICVCIYNLLKKFILKETRVSTATTALLSNHVLRCVKMQQESATHLSALIKKKAYLLNDQIVGNQKISDDLFHDLYPGFNWNMLQKTSTHKHRYCCHSILFLTAAQPIQHTSSMRRTVLCVIRDFLFAFQYICYNLLLVRSRCKLRSLCASWNFFPRVGFVRAI